MDDSVEDKPQAVAATSSWTCPTCNKTCPGELAVCPRDATPRAGAPAPAPASDPPIGAAPASEAVAPVSEVVAPASAGGPSAGHPIATQIVVRARIARPIAGFIAAASSLAAGAWIAALLAGLLTSSSEPSSGGERALIGFAAIAAIAGVAFLHVRTLRPAWRSAPAVMQHIRPAARALVSGGLTFGALELVTAGAVAVFGTPPLGASARVITAGVVAGLGLCWQKLRLDDRLRRWIA